MSGQHQELITQALANTLDPNPTIRSQAELTLKQAKTTSDHFGLNLIAITQNQTLHTSIRQASALAFKNYLKSSWSESDEDQQDDQVVISESDRKTLKEQLVATLISLSDTPQLQIQYQESISIVADADFPDQWPDLIDQIVQRFSLTDWKLNNSLLSTAHAIFKRWRSQFRTDSLFLQIKFHLDSAISNNIQSLPAAQQQDLIKSLLNMIQIYYDLNSQDIPEFFEDNLPEFMTILHKYLTWDYPGSSSNEDDEEAEAGDLEKIKASICEVAELYSQRYLDVFPMMGMFAETCWAMLTRLGQEQRYDILISKATRFLSVVVRMPSQKALFESDATLEAFCEKIVLPNMMLREFEVEMFEDDPAEFVRRDLEGSDNDTRRQAATNFTRALMEQFEAKVTQIITTYVQDNLQKYASNPAANWKSKDAAVSLLASVASRSSTLTGGVTSTNSLVDVVRFFSEHVVQDLQLSTGAPAIHSVIVADAIKFLHTFRNQLTREQLISVIPLLVPHLRSDVMVIYTYAAHTIERILFIKRDNQLLISSGDIQAITPELVQVLFAQIRKGSTPQLIAQNDGLMKCAMRVIFTARQSLVPQYQDILSNLIFIVSEISKNPSNPKFNHYTFESIAALIRFTTVENAVPLSAFETALFPSFSNILSQDIQDFAPFVFQILSQMLEMHVNDLPEYYVSLLQPLLTPNLWEVRGNIPALVRLLKAYLSVGSKWIVEGNWVSGMLGVFQKLIGSKVNDQYGFELLQALFKHIPMEHLSSYLRNVFVILLTRLQASKTEKYTRGLLYFLMVVMTLEKPQLSPDVIISTLNSIQPGLFCQVMEGVLIPAVPNTPLQDRRVVALGHVSLLTRSRSLQNDSEARLYLPILSSVLRLFTLPQLSKGTEGVEEEVEEHEYQVGFSMLGASKPRGKEEVPALFSQMDSTLSAPYLQWLGATGYQFK
ncbi:Cse1-domain-containing protein [Melampsora americana]|nr:Cse1-domain-containing protein [Melampsora americana]